MGPQPSSRDQSKYAGRHQSVLYRPDLGNPFSGYFFSGFESGGESQQRKYETRDIFTPCFGVQFHVSRGGQPGRCFLRDTHAFNPSRSYLKRSLSESESRSYEPGSSVRLPFLRVKKSPSKGAFLEFFPKIKITDLTAQILFSSLQIVFQARSFFDRVRQFASIARRVHQGIRLELFEAFLPTLSTF